MAQSLSQILLHVIFSTKDREPTIPPELADELYRYLASACDAHDSHAYRIGGMPDHVHIERQREHHAKKTFKEEFIEFLRKYKVDYEERYVWS